MFEMAWNQTKPINLRLKAIKSKVKKKILVKVYEN